MTFESTNEETYNVTIIKSSNHITDFDLNLIEQSECESNQESLTVINMNDENKNNSMGL